MKTLTISAILLSLAVLAARGDEFPAIGGLALRLDAAAQRELRQAASMPATGAMQHVDEALDAADPAAGLRATQPSPDCRPVMLEGAGAAAWRFDGKDDSLWVVGPRRLVPELTVFVLAAPAANAGGFAAMFSASESGQNDYTSGLNIDFGPQPTGDLSVVNVESAGGSGVADLFVPGIIGVADRPFGGYHVFAVRSKIGKEGTELFFDGIRAGARDRLESNIGLDRIGIGARSYSHDPAQPPYAQGFFEGDIAEVIVFDRALDDAERGEIERFLLQKSAALHAMADGTAGHPLEVMDDAPDAQMLVPGFAIEELPLRIGNLTNIRYRADGKVVALGYDGRIFLLSDTDGDGLEDAATPYWDQHTMRGPIGMAVTGRDDPWGPGVFVASKGKVSFFPDRDGDDRADEEVVAATGWKETFHGVDTLGLAIDPRDHSILFGLGCTNFANGYLVDAKTGKAGYDVHDERGTIQRLSADFSRRETVCTGVRFTCALAFNGDGDLFASEQEGATWLPNGNPFDELLHIEAGKHYGFPPRHPKHLPDVIDEPAVIEYGPQHQSTVGMVFNEGVNGGPHFGPAHWRGDILMCGESRGRLWRTKLAKTPEGYVAQNHTIARFRMLLVDACVSPRGDLLVACHSGPPDWGTGPTGEGRLFRISWQQPDAPQPVVAQAAAPGEFRIAFDRPLDPAEWTGDDFAKAVRIEAGEFVSAGDRYETMRPGYQAVRDQMASPRRWVDVTGVSLSDDRRSLVVQVPPQSEPVQYAVTLPIPERLRTRDGIPQQPAIDVEVSLHGIRATLDGSGRRIVLPHPSPAVSRILTTGSAAHQAFLDAAEAPGAALVLDGFVDASNPWVPAVQPGSTLDWDMSADSFCATVFDVPGDDGVNRAGAAGDGGLRPVTAARIANPANARNGLILAGAGLHRALTPQRVFVPWMRREPRAAPAAGPRDDVHGRWLAGRRIFFGEGACCTCHTIRGEGTAFGPDLTNLVHRDRESVLKDLLEPSATINPDQSGSHVRLHDGTTLSGIVVTAAAADSVTLALPGGAHLDIARDRIDSISPMDASLMPAEFAAQLDDRRREDLLTFLLVNPLAPAPIARTDPAPPPPRTRAELATHLPPPPDNAARAAWKPLHILLSAGEKDHGIDEHDYPAWLARWSKLLALADGVTVDTCMGFPEAAQLEAADVAVFYSANKGWNPRAAALLEPYQARGGGLVHLHLAIAGGSDMKLFADRSGLAFGLSAFRHGPLDLAFSDPDHPVTRGFDALHFVDESYWKLHGDPGRIRVLATSDEEGEPRPQIWTRENGPGRVFACIPGHYTWTFDDPLYRLIVLRGIAWAARQPDTDRLSELATVGARIE